MEQILQQLSQIFPRWPLVLVLAIAIPSLLCFFIGKLSQSLKNQKNARKQSAEAVNKSRSVLGGQMAEQIAPYLPGFPCHPGDARFLGKPVDFVAFSGLTQENRVKDIVFVEVKTGKSALNGHEKEIQDAIQHGRVKFLVYRPEL